jgi:hypothetical protein
MIGAMRARLSPPKLLLPAPRLAGQARLGVVGAAALGGTALALAGSAAHTEGLGIKEKWACDLRQEFMTKLYEVRLDSRVSGRFCSRGAPSLPKSVSALTRQASLCRTTSRNRQLHGSGHAGWRSRCLQAWARS